MNAWLPDDDDDKDTTERAPFFGVDRSTEAKFDRYLRPRTLLSRMQDAWEAARDAWRYGR